MLLVVAVCLISVLSVTLGVVEGEASAFEVAETPKKSGFFTYEDTVVETCTKKKVWIGYHSGTQHWTKAKSYTVIPGKYFVSGSYFYDGMEVDIGFSYVKSIVTTIAAKKTKYSRLGVYGDFTFQKIRRQYYLKGKPIGAPSYHATAFCCDYYLKPVYKK